MHLENKDQSFLKQLAEQYTEAKGIHKHYLACIMGMWGETYKLSITKNPFHKDSDESVWWHIGWRASEKAAKMKV
jgi:hypothetical protein